MVLSYVIGTGIANFMNMYAIGTILIIMLAIGLMEQSGYLTMAMKSIVTCYANEACYSSCYIFRGYV